jgi:23S rRNA (uracil1939-C5)-methyltransferase
MKLLLEKPVYGGDCLAHLPGDEKRTGKAVGKAVFVPLTLPGETVSARVVEEKKNFANAELEEVLAASPDRVEPACQHFGRCGGCQYQHASYPAQVEMKKQILRETLTRAGVTISGEIAVLAKAPLAYRNRIRLALIRDENGLWHFGYRGRGSHQIVPIVECPIAAPVLIETANSIADFLSNEAAALPLSEMELFSSADETQLLLTLFCEPSVDKLPADWIEKMVSALPAAVAGMRLQVADGTLSPSVIATAGANAIAYDLAGFGYQVPHGAFFQVNRWLVDEFVELVTQGLSGRVAWDLYAGVGLFARQLAHSFAEVVAVETAPSSLPAMERNLAGTSARALSSTTLDYLRKNRELREPRPDAIVLDPPRAGLGDEVTTLLNAIHAPQMVYVSCDPATLARDLRALTLERYRIERITLVDMFPQTFHLETVVYLRRI